jgi:REP element-mobilizing transposase RayT
MDTNIYFITWNTYGTWLPGDSRGWRKRRAGDQEPRPLLEAWCKKQMNHDAVFLSPGDRATIDQACRQHCQHRGWGLLAVNARTNHVHVVVAANAEPKVVRDQLKANCTRALRQQAVPLNVPVTWAKGGDVEILDTDDDVETVVQYVMEAQDRMDRGK